MKKADEMDKVLDAYLAAVAAQLAQDRREDITAELKDEILTRVEVREEELGRTLTPDELEQMLREVGHPLVVAACYTEGPQGIVGPELYPWWLFCVRVALIAVCAVTMLDMVMQAFDGRGDVVDVIIRGVRKALYGGVFAIGVVTAVGWIIERLERKPEFLTKWRVRDLGLYQWPTYFGTTDVKAFGAALNNGVIGVGPKGKAAGKGTHDGFSPVAGAAASAVFTTIILAWWVGGLGGIEFNAFLSRVPGDHQGLGQQVYAVLYAPFSALLMARIVFDVVRVATGSPIKLTAAGDVILIAATIALMVWFWLFSPISQTLGFTSLQDLLSTANSQTWRSEPLVSVVRTVAVFALVAELIRLGEAVLRLVTGKDRRQPREA